MRECKRCGTEFDEGVIFYPYCSKDCMIMDEFSKSIIGSFEEEKEKWESEKHG
jgi:endogenous inhibitor of DNA gyrase (YacG/DUF329 family)